jgi:hypothetical protein
MSRRYTAIVYMGPNTYYSLDFDVLDIVEAAKIATDACLQANPLWRVVRLSEASKEGDNAPLVMEKK